MSEPTDFSPLSAQQKKDWGAVPLPQIGIEEKPSILNALLDMKYHALERGINGPFTARMTKATWNDLRAELGVGVVIQLTGPLRKGGKPEIDGIVIDVVEPHGAMRQCALVDLKYGIELESGL